ncbi:MAG: polyprenyl synthetase family protein [Chloroflexi bacterium]|nr:polyprenyl synthetase family protein [Chloroflexota bacterium]
MAQALADRCRAALEQELQRILNFPVAPGSADCVAPLLHHHMGWDAHAPLAAGKRTRALMVLLCAGASGGRWQRALPMAAAVELAHNFSLVHDDIQDESALRRGRPTVWSVWGRAQGINAGDALFAHAHLVLANAVQLPPAMRVRALQLLGAACVELTAGQQLDLAFENEARINPEQYLRMAHGKTAALLAAAAEMGALAGGATARVRTHYRQFGAHLGIAFQIRDDVLGIWGTTASGKSAASDIESRKKTLPLVYGCSVSPALAAAYRPLAQGGAGTAEIIDLLEQAGARAYAEAREQAAARAAEAQLALAQPRGVAGSALRTLTAQLLGRAA